MKICYSVLGRVSEIDDKGLKEVMGKSYSINDFSGAQKIFEEARQKSGIEPEVLNKLNEAREFMAEKGGIFDWMLAEHFGMAIDTNEVAMIDVYDLYGDMVEDKLKEMSPEEALDLIEKLLGEAKEIEAENHITVEDISKATADVPDKSTVELINEINEKNKDIIH